jgi:TetR/AcrR family acrAB operon transcriptional repressor
MARRSKDEAEETRENIVAAAIKLFLRDGVSQTTLEKIAAEAGYTRGAVYHHFENKTELLLELLRRAHPPAQEMFDSLATPEKSEDPLGDLERVIARALKQMLSDRASRDIHTIFIFNCEFVEKRNPVFEPECRYARDGLDKTVGYLENAKRLGQVASDLDVKETAAAIVALCSGIITLSLRGTLHETPSINVERALRILFTGLRAEAACKKN